MSEKEFGQAAEDERCDGEEKIQPSTDATNEKVDKQNKKRKKDQAQAKGMVAMMRALIEEEFEKRTANQFSDLTLEEKENDREEESKYNALTIHNRPNPKRPKYGRESVEDMMQDYEMDGLSVCEWCGKSSSEQFVKCSACGSTKKKNGVSGSTDSSSSISSSSSEDKKQLEKAIRGEYVNLTHFRTPKPKRGGIQAGDETLQLVADFSAATRASGIGGSSKLVFVADGTETVREKIVDFVGWSDGWMNLTALVCERKPERLLDYYNFQREVNKITVLFNWTAGEYYAIAVRKKRQTPDHQLAPKDQELWWIAISYCKIPDSLVSNVSSTPNVVRKIGGVPNSAKTCNRWNENPANCRGECSYAHRCSNCGSKDHTGTECGKGNSNSRQNNGSYGKGGSFNRGSGGVTNTRGRGGRSGRGRQFNNNYNGGTAVPYQSNQSQ